MTDDTRTLRFYADRAKIYAQHRKRPAVRRLDGFLALLPAGARILELGCGNGMDAQYMLAQGFEVDATDGTPGMVDVARTRIGERARVMRFEDLDAIDAYDGVWASASLLHVPAAGLPDMLTRIHQALRPGGVFVASFKGGTGEGRDHMGRYFNYPSAAGLEAAYRASGWSDLSLETNMGSGFDTLPTQWLWMTARR
ncbi:MAG: class I SAM-dependent methyltransferase [Devosia sp.]|uniref:class I SAM-dependent methyltransferase n=1 Tax=Devosia sp. TaxID=1871048 RepID=UPI0024CD7040|nr:class I SAM-dependent methyltransferase [Devosia sp.]UYN98508.1 MAG: class I SAM-dependent methyltransferase [Devosia sp.]